MEKEEAEGIGPKEMTRSCVQFPDLRRFSDTEPTVGRGGWVLWRKWQAYTVMNQQVLL